MVLGILGGLGLFALVCIIAFFWALIDIANQKGKDTGWKLVWVLICLILPVIGVIVYYFVSGRKKKK
jgi:uncharacterized membrane protein YhaH (DUF805 family)